MTDFEKVLIVGAGVAGRELLEEIRLHFKDRYKVIGFIDDDSTKTGKNIDRVPVLGANTKLLSLIKKYHINSVFIAIPSSDGKTIRSILENCRGAKVTFKIIPRTLELVEGKVKMHQLRPLQVTDLVGSSIVKQEQSIFKEEFMDKRILVTGAAGSIGSELCRQLLQFSPQQLVAFDWWENGLFELGLELKSLTRSENFTCVIGNVQEKARVQDIVRKTRPHFIFHAAAFKHVPLMQDNPMEAVRNNVFGTENVAKTAYEEGVDKFIYVSTDKAADPQSVMGTTKLVGEHVIAALNNLGRTRYLVVRFGNVAESYGSVIPIFRKQIASGGPVTVTDARMTRFMMTIPEAVQLVLHASLTGKGGEIFVLDMGEQIKIDELGRLMIQLAGFIPDQDIKIKYVGQRTGEKITEQLIQEDEYVERTENQRIFKLARHAGNIDLYELSELKTAVDNSNREKLMAILKKFAPHLAL